MILITDRYVTFLHNVNIFELFCVIHINMVVYVIIISLPESTAVQRPPLMWAISTGLRFRQPSQPVTPLGRRAFYITYVTLAESWSPLKNSSSTSVIGSSTVTTHCHFGLLIRPAMTITPFSYGYSRYKSYPSSNPEHSSIHNSQSDFKLSD